MRNKLKMRCDEELKPVDASIWLEMCGIHIKRRFLVDDDDDDDDDEGLKL